MEPNPNETEKRMQVAVAAVSSGVKLGTAARNFNVPRTTLRNRLTGRPARRGPATVLTVEEEETLEKWVIDCSRKGFPRRKEDLLVSVKEYFDKDATRQNPFTNNLPGKAWYASFLKRHPRISLRTPEGITSAAGNVTEVDIRKWFAAITKVLEEENALEILDDPDRNFNADESNVKLCPKKTLVLAEKGCKDVYEIDQGDSKFAITAMFAYSASGKAVSPMLIFPCERIPADVIRSVPKSWGIGRSDTGWMTAETFYEYIGNCFAPYLVMNNIKLPVNLFVDGHKTHLTREISVLCKELGIILIALYPNATHILQPCDVAAFRPLKAEWRKALAQWRRENPGVILTKVHIAPILDRALRKDMTDALRNGFRTTGLHPFNPDVINYSKCKGHRSQSEESSPDASVAEPPESIASTTSICLEDFRQIVGEDVMKSLTEKIASGEAQSHQAAALERLFIKLGGEIPHQVEDAIRLTTPPTPSLGNETEPGVTPEVPDLTIIREEPVSDEGDPHDTAIASTSGTQRLGDILMWPHSPKRKGKRQTERMPYVVTSKRWKAFMDEKDKKREEEARQKEERKRERDNRKAAREAEKAAKDVRKAAKEAEKTAKAVNKAVTTLQTPTNGRRTSNRLRKR